MTRAARPLPFGRARGFAESSRSLAIGAPATTRPIWAIGAAASIGAGIIHVALGPAHVEELGALGYGFFLSAALQLGWAAVLLIVVKGFAGRASKRSLRSVAISGIAINAAILAAWAWSRVYGLPAGDAPWTPEAVGRPDAIAGAFEGPLVLGLAASLQGWSVMRSARIRSTIAAGAVLAIGMIAVGTLFALVPGEAGDSHAASHAAIFMGPRD